MHPKMHEIRSILLGHEKIFKNVPNRTKFSYSGVCEVTEHKYDVYLDQGLTWRTVRPNTDVIYGKFRPFSLETQSNWLLGVLGPMQIRGLFRPRTHMEDGTS